MDQARTAKSWFNDFKKGLRSLAHHNPEEALKYLRSAIKACPVRHGPDLAKILYFTGVTLKKIGCHDGAVKSWKASYRVRKFRLSDRHLRMFSNEYGMSKQSIPELDDWRAFYSVQLGKYLRTKKSRSLGTLAEQDMIRDLIFDAWQEFSATHRVHSRTVEEKLSIFRSVDIIFPYFIVPDGVTRMDTREIRGLPKKGLCSCGSGLPFAQCCGAMGGSKGLPFGSF